MVRYEIQYFHMKGQWIKGSKTGGEQLEGYCSHQMMEQHGLWSKMDQVVDSESTTPDLDSWKICSIFSKTQIPLLYGGRQEDLTRRVDVGFEIICIECPT